jgi:pyrroloquinoline quinone biosynthesis protein B
MAITATLLGTAQDGGIPQAGCSCARCETAWADPSRARRAVCLGLSDGVSGFLVDATPDIKSQLRDLSAPLSGVLLTHAHIGHYAGLVHLGYEAMNVREIPLYASPRMITFLQRNVPWKLLFEKRNLIPQKLIPGKAIKLTDGLAVDCFPVPHRDEWSDTLAYRFTGEEASLLYIPDISSWDELDVDISTLCREVDIALLDGCFYSADELPGRDLKELGHPLVTDTVERLTGIVSDIRLIHLNHTNPLAGSGKVRKLVESTGIRVADENDSWAL